MPKGQDRYRFDTDEHGYEHDLGKSLHIYEWLTGQRHFQGTAVEMAMQHAMTAPPSLLELVPILSREVEAVCMRYPGFDKQRSKFVEEADGKARDLFFDALFLCRDLIYRF